MLCMALDMGGLEWDEGGAALGDGPTGTDPIGNGVVVSGAVPALVLGALTTNVGCLYS
jgi:hypothetical protein